MNKLYDHETEEAILGAILIDSSLVVDVSLILKPADFYVNQNREIYTAMLALFRESVGIDSLTVEQRMGESATEETLYHIMGLISVVPSLTGALDYARQVKAYSVRRQLIAAAGKIATAANDLDSPVDSVIQGAEQQLVALIQDRHASGPEHISTIAEAALKDSEDAAAGIDTTIATGLNDLDRMTGQLQRSDFVIMAGRPGMGKTALMTQIALNAAKLERRRIAIFSLEMNKRQLAHRFVCQLTGLDFRSVSRGELNEAEWGRYYQAIETLRGLHMHIDDTAELSPMALRSKCRQLTAAKGLDVVMIDYAQLIKADGRHQNKNSESGEISRGLKLLARELDVPVFCLGQLNRGVEGRGDKRPLSSDLRDSGSWEQDADQVWMLYNDEHYNGEMSTKPNVTEVIVTKNRRGRTGTVDLYWNATSMAYANLAREEIF